MTTNKESEKNKEPEKEKELEEMKKKLEECLKVKEEYLQGWQRERADFLNYKKEERERIEGLIKYANEELLLRILPILDAIYLAEKEAPDHLKKENWFRGFIQIRKQFEKFLNDEKVTEIDTKNQKFDPSFHEAVEFVEKEGAESGTIVEVLSRGYLLDGKVLRPAKVKVVK